MYDIFEGCPPDVVRCPECGILYFKTGPYGLVPHLIHDHTDSEPARWLILQMMPGLWEELESLLT